MICSFKYQACQEKYLKYGANIFVSLIIALLLIECEKSNSTDLNEILSGYWESRIEVYISNDDGQWNKLDDNFVASLYTHYSFWEINTSDNYVRFSQGCDFDQFITSTLSINSNKNSEFQIGEASFDLIDWGLGYCNIETYPKLKERHSIFLTKLEGDYSGIDYRNPVCGSYKGSLRTWMRSSGTLSEKIDSNKIVIVEKLNCSPDLIKLDKKDVFKLDSKMEFGYSKFPDGILYRGKFINGNQLEITIRGCSGDCGSEFIGKK